MLLCNEPYPSSTLTSNFNMTTADLRNPLFQHDLFLCVLNCLAAPEADFEEFEEARPTLFSLARTCRAFSEPSLDRLWYKLGGLEPLIQCYATESTEERGKAFFGCSSSSISPLTVSTGASISSERMGHHSSLFPSHKRAQH